MELEGKFKAEKALSREERLHLIQTLNALPAAQFGELLFSLAPPPGNIPSGCSSQSQRSQALLEWAESPIGPGLQVLEDLLNKIITRNLRISSGLLSFVISGKISNTTAPEIRAFVQLLRKKTGDDSIDVAFYEEGSIRLILSGSSDGLERLKELYDSGDLEFSEMPLVEEVRQIDRNNSEDRKARLIQALKLRSKPPLFSFFITRIIDLITGNDHIRALSLERILEQALARANDDIDRIPSYNTPPDLRDNLSNLTSALFRARSMVQLIVTDESDARSRANDLANDLTFICVLAPHVLSRGRGRSLVRDLFSRVITISGVQHRR